MRKRMWLWGAVGLLVLAAAAFAVDALRPGQGAPGHRPVANADALGPRQVAQEEGPSAHQNALRPDQMAPEQRLAARVMGVPPEAIQAARTEPTVYGANGERATWWRYSPPATQGSSEEATIMVDIEMYYVAGVDWKTEGSSGSPLRMGFRPLSRDAALEAASSFALQRCPFWRAEDRLAYEKHRDYADPPVYEFIWEGLGPEEFRHRLSIEVSTATGQVVRYHARLLPADPPASVPVRVSEAEAVAKVIAKAAELWPGMHPPFSAEVYLLWTRSPFAPPGTPVYMLNVRGTRPGPRGEPGACQEGCGVDASTGEVLTRSWRGKPAAAPTSRLSPSDALAKARSSLPTALTDIRVVVGNLTWTSPVAVAGTLVYPARVSGRLPSPDEAGEFYEWAQTWAVDAQTGRVHGLGVRRAD